MIVKENTQALNQKIKDAKSNEDQIKAMNEARLLDLKDEFRDKVTILRSQNDEALQGQQTNYENKLSDLKEQLTKTDQYLNKSKEDLIEYNKANLADRKLNHAEKIFSEENRFNNQLTDLYSKKQQALRSQNDKLENNEKNNNLKNEIMTRELNHRADHEIKNIKRDLKEAVRNSNLESERILKENKNINHQLLNEENKKQEQSRTQIHFSGEQQLLKEKEYQASLIAQKETDFKTKVKTLDQNYQTSLKEISDRLNQKLMDQYKKHSNQLTFEEKKGNEEFYHLKQITPECVETPQEFMISVKSPDFEKDHWQLSTEGRRATLTHSRQTKNARKNDEGESAHSPLLEFKSSQSEMSSVILKSNDLLNSRKISRSYDLETQTLTFTIKKL